jgi:hypothetical protein
MGITHETATRDGLADYIATQVDSGTAGKLKIYNNVALTTLLATFALPHPSFGAASGGVITCGAITSVNASATGTAGGFSVTTSADVVIFKGDAGVAGSGAACILATTSVISGTPLSVNSLTYAASP